MKPSTSLSLLNRLIARARLRHMQALIKLSDLRNMGRAAESMGITQPAMSQLIADLENLLEIKLFLRHAKGVDPTLVALDLVKVARRIVAATQDGAELISSRLQRDTHFVRIATTAAAAGGMLSKILPEFSKQRPDIQVQVTEVVSQTLDACFVEDEYDIVCCRWRDVTPEGWDFTPCVLDQLVVVCTPEHPLATLDNVSSHELQRATWLSMPVGTVARDHFEEMVVKQNWPQPKQCHVITRDIMILWPMLKQATLLALVPRSNVLPWIESGALIALKTNIHIPLGMIGFLRKQHASEYAAGVLADFISSNTKSSFFNEATP